MYTYKNNMYKEGNNSYPSERPEPLELLKMFNTAVITCLIKRLY